ncbi:MAG: hypothetical protein IPH60_10830 [Flavobacteriales bacterium]|nr:hypothetical protein [Flavobacteriales bacterium]
MDRQLRTESRSHRQATNRSEDQLVAHVDALILAEFGTDPQTERQYDLLRTIPGVGPQLAAYLVACTDGFTLQHAAPARAMPVSHPSSAAQAQRAWPHPSVASS